MGAGGAIAVGKLVTTTEELADHSEDEVEYALT
jgi:hypothetical protein